MNEEEVNTLKNVLDKDYYVLINKYDYEKHLAHINYFRDYYKIYKITITDSLNVKKGYIFIGACVIKPYMSWSPLMKFSDINKYLKLKTFW